MHMTHLVGCGNQKRVKENDMTKVKCTFEKCLFIKDGICQKEEIELDFQVRYIDCGCPNAEWEEEGE